MACAGRQKGIEFIRTIPLYGVQGSETKPFYHCREKTDYSPVQRAGV